MNKRGSITIEAAIIVPIVLIIAVAFIVIFVSSYHYEMDILKANYQSIDENIEKDIEKELDLFFFKKDVSYLVKPPLFTPMQLQNAIEYAIYLYTHYKESVKEVISG